ncbi:MAG: Tex family protein [Bacteroidota bacterium]|nr:Tex family protein [Bacteroidota bacterium]
MNNSHVQLISKMLNLQPKFVKSCLNLLLEGATIPFISRYRKERTGSMDEVEVEAVKKAYEAIDALEKRKEAVLKSIAEQDLLDEELKQKIQHCDNLIELEDIYLPYKPKRKTRGSIAKSKGLEPLAKILMAQRDIDFESRTYQFLNDEVESVEEALQGARDIIAEWVSESAHARNAMRRLFQRYGVITSRQIKKKVEENPEAAGKFIDYFEFSEPIRKSAAHRVLAIRRGETEGFLRVHIAPDSEEALEQLYRIFLKSETRAANHVENAVDDSYKRLLQPVMETEFKALYKEKADAESIRVFAENLKQLLMSPPLGRKAVLAIDPGFRTGCKIVCLSAVGELLHNETIFPHPPKRDVKTAKKKVSSLVDAYKIDAIAIGNATASRETEAFIKTVSFSRDVSVFMVSENGASIYSASAVAREEFPQYDVTVRGAVSIGRRLIDPLAELVKIDPKSIGVGQYQHDVDQKKLQESLDRVVESCVNAVGVDLNTASRHLLTHVSGLGTKLAQNIVDFRAENGGIKRRSDLKKVKLMGDKAFEQAAGFLRVKNGVELLDDSAVHPEAYGLVREIARKSGKTLNELIGNSDYIKTIPKADFVTKDFGLPTINDILNELAKPGLDPRPPIKVFTFSDAVRKMEDLHSGMKLPGIVTNLTRFGAFVDVGVKQDGLIHVSNMADRFVSDPAEIVKLHQHVIVEVLNVDVARKRIQLKLLKTDAEVF